MELRIVLLWLFFSAIKGASRPYINDEDCPRKPDLAVHRHCLKKCRTDLDCKGRNRHCLCDDVCGKACVKPSQKCETLKPIFNGRYEIDPSNILGARVRYSCNTGYALQGDPERVCQGDGYWSAQPPTCEEEGNQSDHAQSPMLGRCQNPPDVPHAVHDGPAAQVIYPLGAQLNYKCEEGYNTDGFFRSMCVGDGRWVGPRMTCSPRRCGLPGEVEHASRDGNAFVYPNRIKYSCEEGYEMIGRSFRVCMANGEWSGSLPSCIPTKCPRLAPPINGDMLGTDNAFGAVVRFSCSKGFEMVGDKVRRCQQNKQWSGSDVHCTQMDCGQPGPFYNGYLDGGSTTYGSEYKFRCYGRTTFEGPSLYTVCQADGTWSHPVPKCWEKCPLPRIANGTIHREDRLDDYATHGDRLNVTCSGGHVSNSSDIAQCHNGSWTFIPACVPAPCKNRPSEIREGYVRFYTMNHGDRAKYKCNTGYRLQGDEFVTCQYGRWEGNMPRCEPVYCPYPGTIENGIILLVGMIGKYEYRSYVRRTEHNQEIQFHCSKEYKRVGAAAATCVDGVWSPPDLPKCIPKQHPKLLYLFRGKRSLADSDNSGNNVILFEGHEWSNEKGFCEVPTINQSLTMNYPAGYYVTHGSVLEITCTPGYRVLPPGGTRCNDGEWTQHPTCELDANASNAMEQIDRQGHADYGYYEDFLEDLVMTTDNQNGSADTHTDTHADTKADIHTDPHADIHADTHADTHADIHAVRHSQKRSPR